jgi:uncharacterized OB-fold protein
MAHLHYTCWNCGEDNRLDGERCDCCDLIDVPLEWDCWNCGASNSTPED